MLLFWRNDNNLSVDKCNTATGLNNDDNLSVDKFNTATVWNNYYNLSIDNCNTATDWAYNYHSISHIMIIQLYHIILISDNRQWYCSLTKISNHLKNDILILIIIISSRELYFVFENYHIISKMIFEFQKLSYHIENNISIFKIIIS